LTRLIFERYILLVIIINYLIVIFRLPDDDREISVFDYFVDESGEWDTWSTRYALELIVGFK